MPIAQHTDAKLMYRVRRDSFLAESIQGHDEAVRPREPGAHVQELLPPSSAVVAFSLSCPALVRDEGPNSASSGMHRPPLHRVDYPDNSTGHAEVCATSSLAAIVLRSSHCFSSRSCIQCHSTRSPSHCGRHSVFYGYGSDICCSQGLAGLARAPSRGDWIVRQRCPQCGPST